MGNLVNCSQILSEKTRSMQNNNLKSSHDYQKYHPINWKKGRSFCAFVLSVWRCLLSCLSTWQRCACHGVFARVSHVLTHVCLSVRPCVGSKCVE